MPVTSSSASVYLADTNIYVTAANDPEARGRFESFLEHHGPLPVSAVVVAEVLLGIRDVALHTRAVQALGAGITIAVPSADDWYRAAGAVVQLGGAAATKNRSFWNDALLAAQCARLGATLITRNTADFRRLRRHLGVRAIAPFPS